MPSEPHGERSRFRSVSPEWLATGGVYAVLGGGGIIAWLAHRNGIDPTHWSTPIAAAVLAAAAAIGLGTALLAWSRRAAGAHRTTRSLVPAIASTLVVLAVLAAAEVALRMLAVADPMGERIGDVRLLPYRWDTVRAHNRALLEKSRATSSYFVADPAIGWAPGPARRSADGLYASSVEGVRSEHPGERLLTEDPGVRIALTGDSFAFSEEVSHGQSLHEHLRRALGDGHRVVTFGVPGYGVDQAVRRYERDARPWRPQVAILQFVQDDINRIGSVYLFNKPDWALPFVKPRYVLEGGTLVAMEPPAPDAAFAAQSVFDLPHLDLDFEFEPHLWRPGWADASVLMRYLASIAPRAGPSRGDDPRTDTVPVAVALIERFVATARRDGAVPLVVYFPSRGDFVGQDRRTKDQVIDALRARGIDVVNPSACMREAGDASALIVPGGTHYSEAGNARMAQCLLPALRPLVPARPPGAA
jgi:hypothetical protein